MTGGGGEHRDVGELRALEHGHERRVLPGRSNGLERIARRLGRDGRNRAGREHDDLIAAALLGLGTSEDLLGEPREIDRVPRGERASVFVNSGFGEDCAPEAARARHDRPAGNVHAETGGEQDRVQPGPPEGALLDMPPRSERGEDVVQPARSQRPIGDIRRVEVEGEPYLRGRQLRHRAEEVRQPAVALRQQRAHVFDRLGRAAADERLPRRLRGVAARQDQGGVHDPQARRRGRESRRMPLGQIRYQIGPRREPRARGVVEREQPVIQQGGVARSHDRRAERLRCGAATKHDVDPDRRRQRQRERGRGDGVSVERAVSRVRRGRPGRCQRVEWAASQLARGIKARQERPEGGIARIALHANRRVVGTADEVEEELTAIGSRAVVDGRERAAEAARQRHLAERAGLGRTLGVQGRDGGDNDAHADADDGRERKQTADVQHAPLSRRILHSTATKSEGVNRGKCSTFGMVRLEAHGPDGFAAGSSEAAPQTLEAPPR